MRSALAKALLEAGLTVELPVFGESMWPRLRAGDRVTIEPTHPAALHRGDVVAAEQAGGLLVHRLIRRRAGSLILRGDACPGDDLPIPRAAALGRVVAVRRRGRIWRLDSLKERLRGALRARRAHLGGFRSRIAFAIFAAHPKRR